MAVGALGVKTNSLAFGSSLLLAATDSAPLVPEAAAGLDSVLGADGAVVVG